MPLNHAKIQEKKKERERERKTEASGSFPRSVVEK